MKSILLISLVIFSCLVSYPKQTPIGFATLDGGVTGETVTVSSLAKLVEYAQNQSKKYVILVDGRIKGNNS